MAVRMRLMRMGKKKQPMYRVVVVDKRSPRDGRYIEQIGRYEPLHDPSIVEIDNERAVAWLEKGATPSETVEKLLNISGAMNTMKVQTGGIHVVGLDKTETTSAQDVADDVQAEPEESTADQSEAEAATEEE